jgi:hypothetical protein
MPLLLETNGAKSSDPTTSQRGYLSNREVIVIVQPRQLVLDFFQVHFHTVQYMYG